MTLKEIFFIIKNKISLAKLNNKYIYNRKSVILSSHNKGLLNIVNPFLFSRFDYKVSSKSNPTLDVLSINVS
jgi:hypothetical protein